MITRPTAHTKPDINLLFLVPNKSLARLSQAKERDDSGPLWRPAWQGWWLARNTSVGAYLQRYLKTDWYRVRRVTIAAGKPVTIAKFVWMESTPIRVNGVVGNVAVLTCANGTVLEVYGTTVTPTTQFACHQQLELMFDGTVCHFPTIYGHPVQVVSKHLCFAWIAACVN
jgi:hypothetical protein